jgi:hypothetical protein
VKHRLGVAPPTLLLGTVRGLESEGPPLRAALEGFSPQEVALSLSEEEITSLRRHFPPEGPEPLVPLSPSEMGYARGLCRFGEVRVPSPGFLLALHWAEERHLPVRALDPGDDRYAELYVKHIGYLDLLRRNRSERSLARAPPVRGDAAGYAEEWESRLGRSRGSRRLETARAEFASQQVQAIRRSLGPGGRLALVVDIERFPTLERVLGPADPEARAPGGPLPDPGA